jgi:hypothetical protein
MIMKIYINYSSAILNALYLLTIRFFPNVNYLVNAVNSIKYQNDNKCAIKSVLF